MSRETQILANNTACSDCQWALDSH